MRRCLQEVHTLFVAGALGGLSDGQLLDRFLARQDEAAFAELVRRHGTMVMGVCRRCLSNHHDAEDAFQATFLVLARCAGAVRPPERLAAWLHGVAWRVARKARATSCRRRVRERLVPALPDVGAPVRDPREDLSPVLDQELRRLPERYRAAVVLCDLEGRSRKLAAEALGWPEGTLSSRLARGRALLARRLQRRGIGLTTSALAALSTAQPAPAAGVSVSTARTAALFAAGSIAVESTRVLVATQKTLREMLMSKLKVLAAGVTVAIALGGAGAAGLAGQGAAGQNTPKAPASPARPGLTVQAHGPGHLGVADDQSVVTADGAVLELGDGSKLEFLKGDDGYVGRVLPAGKESAPIEFSFGNDGVTLRQSRRAPGVEPTRRPKTLRDLEAERDWLTHSVRRMKRLTASPERDAAVRRGEAHLEKIVAQIEAAPKGRINLHLLGDVAIDRPEAPVAPQTNSFESIHRPGFRDSAGWKSRQCIDCHTSLALSRSDGREAVRDLLVRQTVRDIEAALKRIEQDIPDPQSQREALEQVEAAVRTLTQRAKQRSTGAPRP